MRRETMSQRGPCCRAKRVPRLSSLPPLPQRGEDE